ncbi:transposase [Dyadobacter frigoris]|uniref:IS3 family transposase n=2 Tax=Dyadobacter frigoris TaxID=2576211 RepID=A0A4U6D7L5_9BACT|nr:IS3 family transposase [Dyadobacter frigoris]GLU54705.1 transposase [Dyadobacter frigoris]
MCKVLNESVSSYYHWLKDPIGKRQQGHQELSLHIREVYEENKGCYGSPRVTAELQAKGFQISRPRVARVMRKIGLKSIVRKKYRIKTTDSNHACQVSENYLNRDFTAENLGEKWVSDLTYIKTGEGWVYLTAILDLANRKVVGWALSDTMKAEDTSVAALKMAFKNYPVKKPMLFHSDRGIQYACNEFRKQLIGLPITQSMSRRGDCWDNAPAESFFKTLKTEMVYHKEFKSKQEAKLAIFEFIEVWYNRKRRHSSLGYLSPLAFEEKLLNEKNVA